MRASYNWLRELTGIDASASDFGARLTAAGVECEAVTAVGVGLDSIVVAEVRAARAHPSREKLSLVTVFDGVSAREVVCGAPNVPAPGRRVIFARLGACLAGGLEIAARKIGGIESSGMICSETELGIGESAEGIFVFPEDCAPAPGVPVAQALDLVDHVLELSLTPNRPDCLGHVGLARELAALFGVPFRLPTAGPVPTETGKVDVSISIAAADRCPRYGAQLVRGLRVGPSPFWLRYRLHTLGLRSISNVVDVTNLVLLEWGHPIHGFDLARLRGRRIDVRLARPAERMKTLDGIERQLTEDDLLICDGEGPVAVAGVMGGEASAMGPRTTDVLIECAYFDPRSVMRTARRLGLHTDSSHRFERGVDANAVPLALRSAAARMALLGGGVAARDHLDVRGAPIETRRARVRHARITLLLGTPVEPAETERILGSLGCTLERVADGLSATLPSWRPDLAREADLIEEVARVRGYDKIPVRVPHVRPSRTGTDPSLLFLRRVRTAAAAAGADEAVTYAFIAPDAGSRARSTASVVRLRNPLSEDRSVLRATLLPGLLEAAVRSQRHQVARIRLFEIGRVFEGRASGGTHAGAAELPTERRMMGIVLVGPRGGWIGPGEATDFYDAKGLVEATVLAATGRCPDFAPHERPAESAPFLHPRRCASIRLGGQPIGVAGELHPDVADAFDVSPPSAYAELDCDALWAVARAAGEPQARPLPKFPAVARDIAMLVSDEFSSLAIAAILREAAGDLAESVELFDLYRGAPVPDGKRSLAYRITYRDPERTLTDAVVDAAHSRVRDAAAKRLGAELR